MMNTIYHIYIIRIIILLKIQNYERKPLFFDKWFDIFFIITITHFLSYIQLTVCIMTKLYVITQKTILSVSIIIFRYTLTNFTPK